MSEEQNETMQIPEEIKEAFNRHFVMKFEDDSKIFVMDLEVESEERDAFKEVGKKVAEIMLNKDYKLSDSSDIIEIIDVIKQIPNKQVFLLTQYFHITKHYLREAMRYLTSIKYVNSENSLKKRIRVYTNETIPYPIGIISKVYSLSEEMINKIMDTIMETIYKHKGLLIDEIKELSSKWYYAIYKENFYIYRDKILLRYILTDLSDSDETENRSEIAKEIRWFRLYQIDINTLNDFLDP